MCQRIDTGMRIRSAGNGEPGLNGGPNGDLFVEVGVKSHHVFERRMMIYTVRHL